MWENETVVLVTSLKKRILGGREKVRFERIEADNAIPGFIKRMFRDRVELYMVKESPMVLKSTPHFDLDISELNNIKDHSNAVLIGAASFFEKEIEQLLREALVLRLDFLVRPVYTLENHLFQNESKLTVAQIEDITEPFKKTLPYGEMLIRNCQMRGSTDLDKNGYQKAIQSVLDELSRNDAISWIIKEFTVLTDYLSESKGEEVNALDGQLIHTFLQDRQQLGFDRALDVEMKLGRHQFTPAELQVTLRRYQELMSEFKPSQPAVKEIEIQESLVEPEAAPAYKKEDIKLDEEPEPFDFEIVEEEVKQPESEEESLDIADDWVIDDGYNNTEDAKPETAIIEPVSIETESDESDDEAVSEDKEDIQPGKGMRIIRHDKSDEVEKKNEESTPLPGVSLTELIDNRTEKSFVKKLFGGERDAYEGLISKLEGAESWRVAKILIDNELFKRDVDPFSREAIKLVDLVYGRYYPEENAGGQ